MDDKIVAGAVTAVVVAPICAFCILGPAVVGSLLGGISGWIGGDWLVSPITSQPARRSFSEQPL